MNERTLRPANVFGAALVLGAITTLAFPAHAIDVLRVVLVTGAVAAALHALARNVPTTGWLSPFRWLSPFARAVRTARTSLGEAELAKLGRRMGQRRQRLPGATPLPPDLLRLLRPIAAAGFDMDLRDPTRDADRLARLSPLARAVLLTEPLRDAYWFFTVRPDPTGVAAAVNRLLDEIEAYAPEGGLGPTSAPPDPRETS